MPNQYRIIKRTTGASRVSLVAQYELNPDLIGPQWLDLATANRFAKKLENDSGDRWGLTGKHVTMDRATSDVHAMTLLKEIIAKHKQEQLDNTVAEDVLWEVGQDG